MFDWIVLALISGGLVALLGWVVWVTRSLAALVLLVPIGGIHGVVDFYIISTSSRTTEVTITSSMQTSILRDEYWLRQTLVECKEYPRKTLVFNGHHDWETGDRLELRVSSRGGEIVDYSLNAQ